MPKYLVVGPASFGMPGDLVELTEAEADEANAMAAFPVVQRRPETGVQLGTVGQGVDSPMDQVLAVAKEAAAHMMMQQGQAAEAFVAQQTTPVKMTFTQVKQDIVDEQTAWRKVGEQAPSELKLPEHLQTEVTDDAKQVDAALAAEVHALADSVQPEGAPLKAETPKAEVAEPTGEAQPKKGSRKSAK